MILLWNELKFIRLLTKLSIGSIQMRAAFNIVENDLTSLVNFCYISFILVHEINGAPLFRTVSLLSDTYTKNIFFIHFSNGLQWFFNLSFVTFSFQHQMNQCNHHTTFVGHSLCFLFFPSNEHWFLYLSIHLVRSPKPKQIDWFPTCYR